ncbi:nucleoside hydrolase [Halalkalibaculum sp. DA3122]|uniref:nucleoside hydrolase n=1 Tax=Halalkalibaculum sp. DA3122 TaxID=3373607 RepID=UPI003754AE93
MKKLSKYFLIWLMSITLYPLQIKSQDKPVSVIYDTDMGPMTDDVGALAILHAMADNEEAKLLATVASNTHPTIAQLLDVFNTYYGRPNIPIGVPKGLALEIKDAPEVCCFGGWTNKIVGNYPADIRSNKVVPSSVEIYRKILSNQPDHSVTIVTVGFLTNLSNLLVSRPDRYSKLNGKELVKKKVQNLVSMAGTFTGPVNDPQGPNKEYNLYMDAKASKHVFENWPTEIIFSGFALGVKVRTGGQLLQNDEIEDSPVKDVMRMVSSGKSGASFDQTAVLVAVHGAETYFDLVPGKITVSWNGSNGWDSSQTGHFYLKEKKEGLDHVENVIDNLMQQQPTR